MAKTRTRTRNARYRLKFVFSGTRFFICLVLLALLAGAYVLSLRWFPLQPNKTNDAATADFAGLRWHTVDVGQGDCTIVQFPDDKVLMVDAGSENHDKSSSTILQYLQTWQIATIDWFVITHPDEDHYGGATKLLAEDNLTFKELYYSSAFAKNNSTYNALIENYPFQAPDDGEVIQGSDYTITFVSPFSTDKASNSNDASLMMTIEYYNKIFVLTGDASSAMDDEFINHATELHLFDDKLEQQIILKVAHHGSRTGSSNTFLAYIFNNIPEQNFALISCGKDNSYKHPHQETLERLGNYVSAEHLLVTKDVGDIVIQATATTLTINDTDYTVNVTAYIIQSAFFIALVVVVVVCFCRVEINTKTARRK
ncbi:MAG: MBL fold metallo-hydrolase [Prevotella sp.]|nr:MBL fold metallo-hydrolase [Prevotella sp.]